MATTDKGKRNKSKNGNKTHGRNKAKCERYRSRVGKPLGKGVPGNKAGKNKRRKRELPA